MGNIKQLNVDFFEQIDWSELRNQKSTLFKLIVELDKGDDDNQQVNDLDGILHLIDAIQDYAVDKLEIIDPIHVYNFEEEDGRDD